MDVMLRGPYYGPDDFICIDDQGAWSGRRLMTYCHSESRKVAQHRMAAIERIHSLGEVDVAALLNGIEKFAHRMELVATRSKPLQ